MLRSRLIRVVLGVLLALLAAELVLQVLAYVIWSGRDSVPSAVDRVAGGVVCIGDSFTFGLGARDRVNAYPEAMGRALRAAGHDVSVVNAGWPGDDSGDVLERLPRILDAHRPRLCYVLVGYNDFWKTSPARDLEAGFPLEFRLGKLASLLYHAVLGTAGSDRGGSGEQGAPGEQGVAQERGPETAPFLGTWHQGELWLRFRADGVIETPQGPMPNLFSLRGDDRIVLLSRADNSESELHWQLDGARLSLAGGPFPAPLVLEPGLPVGNVWFDGVAAEQAGDLERATACYRAALGLPGRAAAARSALVRVLSERGVSDEARLLAAGIDTDWRASGDAGLAEAAAEAWLDVGDVDAAVDVALACAAAGDVSDDLMLVLTHHGRQVSDPHGLADRLGMLLATGSLGPRQRATLAALRSRLAPRETRLQAEALYEVYRYEGSSRTFERTVADIGAGIRAEFLAVVEERTSDLEQRAGLIAAFDAAGVAGDHTDTALAANLGRIAAECRRRGVEPVLLAYPIERAQVAMAVEQVAVRVGAAFVDLHARFRAGRSEADYEALFVLDGHCNDVGYRLMGEILAEHAAGLLR